MKNVILRAPLLSVSGYGVHSRQIFRWLLTENVNVLTEVVNWGNTAWMLNQEMEKGLVGEIMKRSRPLPGGQKADVSIQVQLPNEWDPGIAKVNIGVSAWVETDRCNPDWIVAANRMSAIVVPSNFTKSVIYNTGSVNVPVYVIPEAFIEEVGDLNKPIDLDLSTDFNFLLLGQITGNNPENDRKNTYYALKWLCEEFKDCPDVGIVIKTNSARNTTIDKAITRNTLKQVVSNVRKGPYPKIHFLHGEMRPDEIAALYKHPKIKALVSLTRGEGWGLPLLEAAASGLPVIATAWSGHLDFMSLGRFIPVKYNITEIPDSRVDSNIFMKGARWANPIENDAKKKIRKFYSKPDLPRQWAKELAAKVSNKFSQKEINRLYSESLSSYLI